MKICLFAATSLVALFTAAPASAQLQNTVRIGVANYQPHSSASDFGGSFTPAGISLEVQDKKTALFSYTREFDDNWEVEFALGLPPTHDVALKVNNTNLPASAQALSSQVGARIRQVAPTAFINYRFFDKASSVRPFVGAGINYTSFDKTSSTAAGNALFGGATTISLEDSVGLALQVGLTYQLSQQWSLTAAIATARVRSKITTNTLGLERSADISFRPRVFFATVGYSF